MKSKNIKLFMSVLTILILLFVYFIFFIPKSLVQSVESLTINQISYNYDDITTKIN